MEYKNPIFKLTTATTTPRASNHKDSSCGSRMAPLKYKTHTQFDIKAPPTANRPPAAAGTRPLFELKHRLAKFAKWPLGIPTPAFWQSKPALLTKKTDEPNPHFSIFPISKRRFCTFFSKTQIRFLSFHIPCFIFKKRLCGKLLFLPKALFDTKKHFENVYRCWGASLKFQPRVS